MDIIVVGNGSHLKITHVGNTAKLWLKTKEILVVPDIYKKLLFDSKLAKYNACIC